ncbi:MAG TPA: hypothetical protein DDY98_03480 [Ruminococcaceae bacterium]|nr:hypothetical protein [Oscillospiraceae bacterium]
MIHEDTIKLLRECCAGIKMGVSSIDEVLLKVKSEELKKLLKQSKSEHERIEEETQEMLDDYGDDGKNPNPMAKGMSWLKTNAMLNMTADPDKTVSGLITDGCNMGVKSLNRYLNQYGAAEERVKDISKKLIAVEAQLAENMREFL